MTDIEIRAEVTAEKITLPLQRIEEQDEPTQAGPFHFLGVLTMADNGARLSVLVHQDGRVFLAGGHQ
jgi:hypothetical protein